MKELGTAYITDKNFKGYVEIVTEINTLKSKLMQTVLNIQLLQQRKYSSSYFTKINLLTLINKIIAVCWIIRNSLIKSEGRM